MIPEPAAASKSNGLAVLWDVVIAPRAAFATLRDRPTAGWAFLVTTVLFAIAAIILIPANQHIGEATFQNQLAHNPQLAGLTPEQQARQLSFIKGIYNWLWIVGPLVVAIGVSVTALLMLIGSAIGGGDGNFRRMFALAANVAIIYYGIGYIVIAILSMLRGPASFSSAADLAGAIPGPVWLAPGASLQLATFLGALNPFNLWSIVLLALGMQDVARVNRVAAWLTALVVVIVPAALEALAAR